MKGFTLFEILIAIIIVVIVMTLAIPGFAHWREQMTVQQAVNEMQQVFYFARINALSKMQTVIICPTHDGRSCVSQWQNDLLVATVDQQHHIQKRLRVFAKPSSGSWDWRGFGGRDYLSFSSDGFGNQQNGRLIYKPDDNNPRLKRELIINRMGRIRVVG